MVDSPGWEYVKAMAEQQIVLRDNTMNAAAEGMDGMVAKEFATGEKAGMILILSLPQFQLNGITEEVEALTEELAQEEDDESTNE